MKIKITSLSVDDATQNALDQDYLYKDLFLDLTQRYSFNNKLNRKEFLNDLQASFDIEAVKNSIKNALLTSPGEKILTPEFGADLRQYLFEPIDVYTSELIQDDIEQKLPEMEPRIEIEDVVVEGDPDNQQYNIEFTINVPSLDVYGLSIKSELNSSGYTIP